MRNFIVRGCAAAALTMALSLTNTCSADWGSSGGASWGGSSGGYGSSGGWGSSGGSSGWAANCGSSGGGWGGMGRHHHHRLLHRWGHGSSGGGWGSSGGGYGSSGGWGSSGGYGSSGGSSGGWGSSGGSSGGVIYSTPSYSPAVPVAPEVPASPVPMSSYNSRNDGLLVVEVPENAKIYVNGRLTSTPGARREYVSRNLAAGQDYTYEVRAEMTVDGKIVSNTKKVNLRAGESSSLNFALPTAGEETETTLTLKVPANAKVKLGGNETTATGDVRVFRSKLPAGTAWTGYQVVVTWEADGRQYTKEQTFDMVAGDNKEFDFANASAELAAAR